MLASTNKSTVSSLAVCMRGAEPELQTLQNEKSRKQVDYTA